MIASWQEGYDKPRQYIKKTALNLDSVLKNRYHFTDKGPYSQSYGFSSSMHRYVLDHKEG